MTFPRKLFLFIVLAVAILATAVYVASSTILLSGFRKIEDEQARVNVDRARDAILNAVNRIDYMTTDWSNWDDTYRFAKDENATFRRVNLTDASIGILKSNLLVIRDARGRTIYSTGFDMKAGKRKTVPEGFDPLLPDIARLTGLKGIKGILLLPDGPMLIASRPLLTSEGTGPARGILILGRFLDQVECDSIASLSHLNIDIERFDENVGAPDIRAARSAFRKNPAILINPLSDREIEVYGLMNDLFGKPALILDVTLHRDIFRQGRATVYLFLRWIAAIGLIFAGAIYLLSLRLVHFRSQRQAIEDRYRSLVAQASEGIALVDAATLRFLEANAAMIRVTGYSAEEILALTVLDLISDLRQDVERSVSDVVSEGSDLNAEVSLLRKDGSTLVAEISVTFIISGARPLLSIILRDVSERKRTEMELRQSNYLLEESNALLEESNQNLTDALDELKRTQKQVIRQERLRALGEMASGIAHDFNNALMPILGFSEILLLRSDLLADEEKAKRYLNLILSAGQGAARTIERLREFYRDPDGDEKRSRIDLDRLIRRSIDLTEPKWKSEARIKGSEIEIETSLASVPEIMGDESDLREALINLIFNAVDAMPEGGILSIGARIEGEEAILEVSDTGIGMSEEAKERCLEPFYTTKKGKGTGMGLATVHGMICRHGGSIEIKSQEGQGTTVSLRFPNASTNDEKEKVARNDFAIPSLSVLVAEDEPSIQELLSQYLKAEGHIVEIARDGEEGWDRFREGRYDLVITDHSMPKMSGEELSKRIKEIDSRKPVIMLTGFGLFLDVHDAAPSVADLILSKPIGLEDLKSGIASLFEKVQPR